MAWIVGERQPLKVGDAYREPGQPIPEADEWPHYIREQYLRDRIIVRVQEPQVQAATAPPKDEKAAATRKADILAQRALEKQQAQEP